MDCRCTVVVQSDDHDSDRRVARPIQEIIELPTTDNLRGSTEPRCQINSKSDPGKSPRPRHTDHATYGTAMAAYEAVHRILR